MIINLTVKFIRVAEIEIINRQDLRSDNCQAIRAINIDTRERDCLTERRRRRRRKERKNRRIISGNSLFQFEQPVNKHRREIEERDSFDVFTVAYRANEKT